MKFLPKNMLKMKYNIGPVLHNRIILYFITILAVLDIVYLLGTNDVVSFSVLILVGLLTSFFNKNMIVILVIAMAVTHVIKYGAAGYVSEGMENQEEESEEKKEEEKKEDAVDKKEEENKEGFDKKDAKDKKKDLIEYADLKKDYDEFQGVHEKIMGNMQQLDPLLNRAEAFINKFEKYKETKEGFKK